MQVLVLDICGTRKQKVVCYSMIFFLMILFAEYFPFSASSKILVCIFWMQEYGFGVLQSKWFLMVQKCLSSTWTLKDLKVSGNQTYMMIGKSNKMNSYSADYLGCSWEYVNCKKKWFFGGFISGSLLLLLFWALCLYTISLRRFAPYLTLSL